MGDTYNEALTYDKNGNITHLDRNGGFESPTTVDYIDNLHYFYDDNSNQLKKVVDLTNNTSGFKDDASGTLASDTEDDYQYDANGNMKVDQNKHIEFIYYNHLNLPTEIKFENGGRIYYTYDASGTKLKKDVDFGTHHEITDYLNGYQYLKKPENQGGQGESVLEFFPTAEGYVKSVYKEVFPFGGAKFQYVYNYTDHLGNIRMSYTEFKGDLVALEETHYYPFGLKHGSYYTSATKKMSKKEAGGDLKIKPTADTNYKYKYNGKEYQNELGLDWYDLGARLYDPAIARFMSIDPLTDFINMQSPYVLADNNPVKNIDYDGLATPWWIRWLTGGTSRRNFKSNQGVFGFVKRAFTRRTPLRRLHNGKPQYASNTSKRETVAKLLTPEIGDLKKLGSMNNDLAIINPVEMYKPKSECIGCDDERKNKKYGQYNPKNPISFIDYTTRFRDVNSTKKFLTDMVAYLKVNPQKRVHILINQAWKKSPPIRASDRYMMLDRKRTSPKQQTLGYGLQ